MKTHFIDDLEDFGISSDDYPQFLAKRSRAVSRELRKRLVPREIDKQGQVTTPTISRKKRQASNSL